jgi:hypothetical protein
MACSSMSLNEPLNMHPSHCVQGAGREIDDEDLIDSVVFSLSTCFWLAFDSAKPFWVIACGSFLSRRLRLVGRTYLERDAPTYSERMKPSTPSFVRIKANPSSAQAFDLTTVTTSPCCTHAPPGTHTLDLLEFSGLHRRRVVSWPSCRSTMRCSGLFDTIC